MAVAVVSPTVLEVAEIYRRMFGERPESVDVAQYKLFRSGSREVLLHFKDDKIAESMVLEREENKENKLPGETTELYKEIAQVLQARANEMGTVQEYHFVSEHPAMVVWAKTAGREIFDWDDEMRVSSAPPGEQEGCLFIKKFIPKTTTIIHANDL